MKERESIKMLTLNIEGDKHFQRWMPIVLERKPDVLALQEVFEEDCPWLAKELKMSSTFVPMLDVHQVNRYNIAPKGKWGIALLTRAKPQPGSVQQQYYSGTEKVRPFLLPNDASRVLLSAQIEVAGRLHTVATTHFTWSGDGNANEEQLRDLLELERLLGQYDSLILGGDFNAPRGREVHTRLSQLLTPLVPDSVKTTIDGSLHYAGDLQLVVDDIFVSQPYTAVQVEVISGVSDHKGVWAELQWSD